MKPAEFERIAREAIRRIPAEFQPYLEDCVITIEAHPPKELLLDLEMEEDEELFGLYEGRALTERSHDDPPEMPPRIRLFYEPLLEFCETEDELIFEIQVTVLHEIGHHFGLDEERLDELGYA